MEENFDLENLNPDIRHLKDMGAVLYDKEWQKTADPEMELYYIYRGLKEKQGFRYDITVIPAKMLGKEFIKTKGHKHSKDYGEVYIVLKGEAIFLMQKTKNNKIEDVCAVKGKKGALCVIPPFYAHFTINPSSKELKIANWLDKNCENLYQDVQTKQGACYFYTTNGWLKNENYKNIPPLRFEQPQNSLPEKLSFLNE